RLEPRDEYSPHDGYRPQQTAGPPPPGRADRIAGRSGDAHPGEVWSGRFPRSDRRPRPVRTRATRGQANLRIDGRPRPNHNTPTPGAAESAAVGIDAEAVSWRCGLGGDPDAPARAHKLP